MILIDILNDLDNINDNLVLCTKKGENVRESSEIFLFPNNVETIPEDLNYFLEVSIAKEVLTVWKEWRNGKEPNSKDKYSAVSYYVERDAYLPNG